MNRSMQGVDNYYGGHLKWTGPDRKKASRWGDLQMSPDEYRKQAGMMKEDDQGRFSPPSPSPSSSKDRVDQGRFSPPPLPASTATSIHEGKDDLGPPLPAKAPAPPPPPPPPPKAPPPPSPPVSPRATKRTKGNQRSTPRMQLNGGRRTAMQRPDALPLLSQSTLQGATHPHTVMPGYHCAWVPPAASSWTTSTPCHRRTSIAESTEATPL